MIEASFDQGKRRSTTVSGAYQYDTGQRLRMHGLPSPGELAGRDEFLSGNMITMQVHFGLKGDSQTQARLARWDGESGCWMAAIPDECLQAAESVYAYVYVSYGMDEAGNGRTKTMYELVFRPVSRPAPNNVATSEQWEAWAVQKNEMDLILDVLHAAHQSAAEGQQTAQASAQRADTAGRNAQQAYEEAKRQHERLEEICTGWEGMKVRTISLEAGAQATASIHAGMLTYGLPRGEKGAKGMTGDTGPADITLSIENGVLTITPKA